VPTPQGLIDPAVTPSAKVSPPAIKADKWIAGLVLFVLVLVVAFFGLHALTRAHPKPSAHAAAPSPAAPVDPQPAPAPSAPKLVDNPSSAAGKAIAKAREVVAANDKLEKEQGVTAVLEESSATPVPPSADATESTKVVAAPVEPPVPPPQPSEVFKQFVVDMRISGIFQGDPPRALVNGKMYRLGDVLEPNRKIELYKIDAEGKQLIFRDFTGATVLRRY